MRIYGLIAGGIAATLLCAPGCFGDNSDGVGSPSSDDLSFTSVEAPVAGVDAEGSRTPIQIRVKGKRDEQLTIAVTSTLGTFSPEQNVVITDAAGEATWSPEFIAGPTGGDAMAVANVANLSGDRVSHEFSFPVVPFTRVGEVAQLPNADAITAGYLEGQSIELDKPGKLRRVGLIVNSRTDVSVGIYSDVAGAPTALLTTVRARLQVGVNELVVPEVMLPAGTYWFMATFSTLPQTPILYRTTSATTRLLKYVSHSQSAALPAVYPSQPSQLNEPQRNVYLVLGL